MNDYYRVTLEILKSTNTHLYPCSSFFCAQNILHKKSPKMQIYIFPVLLQTLFSLHPEQKTNTFPSYHASTFTLTMQFLYTKYSIQKKSPSYMVLVAKKKTFPLYHASTFTFIMRQTPHLFSPHYF